MINLVRSGLFGLLLSALSAGAAASQNHAEILQAVETFVRAQTLTLPGTVAIQVGAIDTRIKVPPCPDMEAFLPPGGRLFGNSTVGVRCTNPGKWTLFVPVQIKVSANMLVANRPLQQGQIVRAEDIGSQSGELAQAAILTDPAEAIGKVLKFSLGAGQVLKQDMLRVPFAVTQGQTVKIQVEGEGFAVHADGQALNNAAEDQNVQVRTYSGQVISGVAKADGIVLLQP